jgi:hypothetical protein
MRKLATVDTNHLFMLASKLMALFLLSSLFILLLPLQAPVASRCCCRLTASASQGLRGAPCSQTADACSREWQLVTTKTAAANILHKREHTCKETARCMPGCFHGFQQVSLWQTSLPVMSHISCCLHVAGRPSVLWPGQLSVVTAGCCWALTAPRCGWALTSPSSSQPAGGRCCRLLARSWACLQQVGAAQSFRQRLFGLSPIDGGSAKR